jgi:MipA family protein
MQSRSHSFARLLTTTAANFPASVAVNCGLLLFVNAANAAQDATPSDYLTLGGGVAVVQQYSGSKEMTARPIPLIDYSTTVGAFISTVRGIGFGSSSGDFGATAAINFRGGRVDHSTHAIGSSGGDELHGMGDVKPSGVVGLAITYKVTDQIRLSSGVDVPFSHRDNGLKGSFGVGGSLWKDEVDELSLGTSVNIGSRRYVQTYFGVTTGQSLDSGISAHAARSGLYSVDAGLVWTHRIDKQWLLTSTAGASRFLGDAADSPIVERRFAPSAALIVGYTY